jgi:aconitate hydratase 2/2-methylisocitrate dehydratase
MDAKQLSEEGHYGVLGSAGARMEMPGCSLCMGNQAQVKEGATVFSTSTRNFPNRLGKNSNVYLGCRTGRHLLQAGPHSHQG